MRIVQIIDSLETGGAERMAVNYANALVKRASFSGLVATRAEGKLKSQINAEVYYAFLGKRYALDPRAVVRLYSYCKKHRVEYLHAHSTSYFLAILIKILMPKLQIIWHDHNGNSEFLEVREAVPLNMCSFFFKGIIVVNHQLKQWALRELHCPKVFYIPNFTTLPEHEEQVTLLKGTTGKQILHLANLREQKNHDFTLAVAEIIRKSHPGWTFHLVGKDFEDEYSRDIRHKINTLNLQDVVYVYGSRTDTSAIIRQAAVAILTSKSEGLPVALLEYGLQAKPVVMTQVGEIPVIVKDGSNGYLAEKTDVNEFAEKLQRLLDNPDLRNIFGIELAKTIRDHHSEEAAITSYLKWIKSL